MLDVLGWLGSNFRSEKDLHLLIDQLWLLQQMKWLIG